MKMKGKPKLPPSTQERAQIVTLAASGQSQAAIARNIGRSRHLVRNTLKEPEIMAKVKDEKAELSQLCREKARDIFVSIGSADIDKANLLQKATAGAIMLDKSLLLSGDPTSINVSVLMDVVDAIRSRQPGRIERPFQSPALPQPEFEP